MADDEQESRGFRIDRAVIGMVFNALLAIGMAVVGFFIAAGKEELISIRQRVESNETSLSVLRERLPLEYVRMDLYIRDRQEMMGLLREIDRNVREHRESTTGNGIRVPR